jgi:GDP/UDP-N,N'-diacetylbacillosamine 2-epimerase (hydrolysing)
MKVHALTGIRSEYDLLYPLLKALHEDAAFELGVIVSGAHLTSLHNHSVRLIEQDGFRIVARIENLSLQDSVKEKVRGTGALISGLAECLAENRPDLLIVLGDREEPLAGAIAGTYSGIPVVHILGGDHTHPAGGDVDEEVRHAITKLSHLHLTMTESYSQRILRLGEEPWRVRTVGNPGIDRLRIEPEIDIDELSARIHPAIRKEYLVLIHHSLSSDISGAAREMDLCIDACLETGLEIFVGAPNSDPGFKDILDAIQRHASNPQLHVYRNLPRPEFTGLLRNARCLVGNSSLGFHEAPFLGLPAVNVGERQRGRLADANVQFVVADHDSVVKAVRRAAFDASYRSSIRKGPCLFGDGHMVERTVEILKHLPPAGELLAKNITY